MKADLWRSGIAARAQVGNVKNVKSVKVTFGEAAAQQGRCAVWWTLRLSLQVLARSLRSRSRMATSAASYAVVLPICSLGFTYTLHSALT